MADPPRWLASWNAGLADEMGVALMGRVVWPDRIDSRRWSNELRLGASKEGFAVGLETRRAIDSRLVPYFRVGLAMPGLRSFDREGNHQNWEYFWTGIASVGYRSERTRGGFFDFGPKFRWTSGDAFVPKPHEGASDDLAFELVWHGDLQDDPRLARRGLAWSLGGALPLAGDERPWVLFADASATVRIGRRFGLSLLGRVAETGDERLLPADRWGDVGAWWEAPGFDPGRGRAREFRRVTVALRRALGKTFGATLSAGVSGAWWRLGENRLDPLIPADGSGASVFLEATTARFGPVTIGFMFSSLEGNEVFVLVNPERIFWPGPVRPREGAIVP